MYTYKAKVLEVYDGDTITVEIDLGFTSHRIEKLRLYGIDTPEIRGPQKEDGKKVRDIVRDAVLGKEVTIETIKDGKGKFGRYLANVILPSGVNLNEWLVNEGHAKEYMK